MSSTYLEILQDASAVLSLPTPSSGESTSNQNIILLRSLLNRLGREVRGEHVWSRLTKRHDFTADSSTYDIYTNITDYDYMTTHYIWDDTDDEPLFNQTGDSYLADQTLNLETTYRKFHFRGGNLVFEPAYTASDAHDLIFYYQNKNWVYNSSSATYKTEFTEDDDTHLLNDEVLIKGLIYKYKHAKGLSYDQEFQDYQIELNRRKDRDTNPVVLKMDTVGFKVYPYANIPDTGYGS